MKILVTGAAGFIGFHLCERLLREGHEVVGLDNINDYYDPKLKYDRLIELGILKNEAQTFDNLVHSQKFTSFKFIRLDLENKQRLSLLFTLQRFNLVCNLAAQAGVRYSLENPNLYVNSNIVGFLNILECCRNHNVKKLVYASSSSVYGNSTQVPFKEEHSVDKPISIYAATKKSNELMAYTYSHLFGIETIGLRFFTVYGPWGRPDMAMFLFTDAILKNKPINVFNNGELSRDFTFISDIIDGILNVIITDKKADRNLYNIGNSKPVQLLEFIKALEAELGKEAKKNMLPMQEGDVTSTWADVSAIQEDFGYEPMVSVKDGISSFVAWYKKYYS